MHIGTNIKLDDNIIGLQFHSDSKTIKNHNECFKFCAFSNIQVHLVAVYHAVLFSRVANSIAIILTNKEAYNSRVTLCTVNIKFR